MRFVLSTLGACTLALVALTMFNVTPANSQSDVLTVELPNEAEAEGMATLAVNIKNSTSYAISFDGVIWHGGRAWGGKDYPATVSARTELYWNESDQGGVKNFWRGTIEPGESARFVMSTFLGNDPGTYQFTNMTFIVTLPGAVFEVNRNITVKPKSRTPTPTPVRPEISSITPMSVKPGDWVTIRGKNFYTPGMDPKTLQVWLVHADGGVNTLATVSPYTGEVSWQDVIITFKIDENAPPQSGVIKVLAGKTFGTWNEEFRILAVSPTPTSTATPAPTNTSVPTATATATTVPTSTPVPPTATATPTKQPPTVTPSPQSTLTPTTVPTQTTQGNLSIALPESVAAGGKAIDLAVTVKNPTNRDLQFNMVVWHGWTATNGQVDAPVVEGATLYWTTGDSEGDSHLIKGTLAPNGTAQYKVRTYSGNRTGTFKFARVTEILTTLQGVEKMERDLTVTISP